MAEIVVGDVAKFKYGNTFPVDGILIQVRRTVNIVCVLAIKHVQPVILLLLGF